MAEGVGSCRNVDTKTRLAPFISGMDVTTCLGRGSKTLFQSARDGISGIQNGLGWIEDEHLWTDSFYSRFNVVQKVKEFPEVLKESRALALGFSSLSGLLEKSSYKTHYLNGSLGPRVGFILGTTTGHMPFWESALLQYRKSEMTLEEFNVRFARQPLERYMKDLAAMTGLSEGPQALLSSACSASTQAIGMGALWIDQGYVDACVVGGVEVLCDLTVEGFKSLQLLSNEYCRPFDSKRSGINLSEGSGFLLLEKSETSSDHGNDKRIFVSGHGFSTDSYHMTGPHPEGVGSYRAMKAAMDRAGLRPSNISWIHAHGTGSVGNDKSEGSAVNALFGSEHPPVSSTKRIHGHPLGAAGAVETILCIEAMFAGVALGTLGLEDMDTNIPVQALKQNETRELKHVLKNTLGFGGVNASLILSKGYGA